MISLLFMQAYLLSCTLYNISMVDLRCQNVSFGRKGVYLALFTLRNFYLSY